MSQGRAVSRETEERLELLAALVRRWNPHINLVSRKSLDILEERHIADSAQVHSLAPARNHWVDLGSGAGFPGLVCAIIAAETSPETRFTLIEADTRKATFLRTAIRELGLSAKVEAKRIEALPPQKADILSARALTDLTGLLGYADHHMEKGGTALFPKGENWEKEVADARAQWSFSMEAHTSVTHPHSVILQIGDVVHV
ncbi:16S rRNA (guanine(527)-N(7))-methyltransferase RsmG [Roseivivax halodurans]|uniref:16S rRNA (guanine(527)-N(7))-methyltransferase RsmG n=1 Tax=Roseivivax halodurans TaxID=93683 RepID=UPI0004B6C4DE